METGYHSSANLPRTCPQHLGTKPGSVAHGNLFFGSGTNLNDGYPRPCHVRRHGNPAHFTSGWIRVCVLLRLELTTSECHGPLSHYRFFYQRTKPTQCFLKSTPELRPLTPSAQNPAREPLTPRMGYPKGRLPVDLALDIGSVLNHLRDISFRREGPAGRAGHGEAVFATELLVPQVDRLWQLTVHRGSGPDAAVPAPVRSP
jgi:hypothetical protein